MITKTKAAYLLSDDINDAYYTAQRAKIIIDHLAYGYFEEYDPTKEDESEMIIIEYPESRIYCKIAADYIAKLYKYIEYLKKIERLGMKEELKRIGDTPHQEQPPKTN